MSHGLPFICTAFRASRDKYQSLILAAVRLLLILYRLEGGIKSYLKLGVPASKLMATVGWYGDDFVCNASGWNASDWPAHDRCVLVKHTTAINVFTILIPASRVPFSKKDNLFLTKGGACCLSTVLPADRPV